jgi:hypothetical protein
MLSGLLKSALFLHRLEIGLPFTSHQLSSFQKKWPARKFPCKPTVSQVSNYEELTSEAVNSFDAEFTSFPYPFVNGYFKTCFVLVSTPAIPPFLKLTTRDPDRFSSPMKSLKAVITSGGTVSTSRSSEV